MADQATQPSESSGQVLRQRTLAAGVSVQGKGLMLGQDATLRMLPAEADHGIVFERVDLDPPVLIPVTIEYAIERDRRTAVGRGDAVVETIEHCMSALRGCGVDNALLQIDGPEVPLGDGSAAAFMDAIDEVGTVDLKATRHVLRIVEPIILHDGDCMLAAFPTERDELRVMYELDYGDESSRIPRQSFAFTLADAPYRDEVAPARTYSLVEEAEALQEQGLCTHLSPADVLVVGDDGPIDNAWRFDNEPVRHKVLDLIGDLMLVGAPICGYFVASRSGHALNRRMCRAIREQMENRSRAERLEAGRTMDIRAIQQIMPHRYPMLLVDRVVEVDGNKRAVGVKNVTINEPFFAGHYPGTPIMPGVLIVEAMAQLGGLLLSQTLEHHGKIAVLLSLDRVKLRHPVTPGDQLVLEAETIRASTRTAAIQCRAHVGAKQVAEAQIRFMMVDADQAHG
jgi:UDP-3-O-[3-hydroxymyristoyl] N-acetylglucosamine deacetylase/3-hydroxyacyl-[acyl-carrier-protein] dehydratase